MDFLFGYVAGFACGFVILYISYHKLVLTECVSVLRMGISDLNAKIDSLVTKLK